jgi:hypothetical protein
MCSWSYYPANFCVGVVGLEYFHAFLIIVILWELNSSDVVGLIAFIFVRMIGHNV